MIHHFSCLSFILRQVAHYFVELVRFGVGSVREGLDFEAVVVFAPFALGHDGQWNLLNRQVREVVEFANTKGTTANQQ